MHASYARYKCMGVLYCKLKAFITNIKDVWDFCLGGLNITSDIPTHFIKPIKIFNGVSVIKLMPLSVFAIKIKEPAPTSFFI
ncbi:hypothetical protein DUHN30_03710 [Helicobacter pylori]